MSGLIAVVRTDGAPVDASDLGPMMTALRVRGPDACGTECQGAVGLGHAWLRTGDGPIDQRQPLTLDGTTWIVADGRVDARSALAGKLCLDPSRPLGGIPDAELILRAYLAWGERSVERLVGDFAFAIWDGAARRLFCARDHLGIKPLYYATVGEWLLVSSAIEPIRRHSAVGDRLDDQAIADYLLFGHNADHAATAFHDVRRVPPAHTLEWSCGGIRLRRYWQLPIEDPIYLRDEEYLEELRALLRQAVSDRLRAPAVGIFLSGGLDSTTLAAMAATELPRTSIRGFTIAYESLIADAEPEAAALAARELEIEARRVVADRPAGWPEPLIGNAPEPFVALIETPVMRCYREMARFSPVALYGEGPDNALFYDWRPYLSYMRRSARWSRLAADALQFVSHHKQFPLVRAIRHRLLTSTAAGSEVPLIPRWMSPDLVARLNLRHRWALVMGPLPSQHAIRPTAYASLLMPLWHTIFDSLDPAYTGASLEVRYPYLDIRVLQFLLKVPAVPWCRDKHLLRLAMKGILPDAIRLRRKTPLAGGPEYERVRRYGLPPLRSTPRLRAFGAPELLGGDAPGPEEAGANVRFVVLSHWLNQLEPGPQTD
jgi:asparagine synthase (glutamine-hydrolysing)